MLGTLCLAAAASVAALAQGFPTVPGNLEQQQVAGGRKLPSSANMPQPLPEDFGNLRFGPGFLVQMDVFDTPEMGGLLRVDDRGDLIIPLLGRIHVSGITLGEAQARIEQAYIAGEILRAPQVTLTVTQYATNNITVLGEVQTPGRVPLLGPKNLADVLALVGGQTISAGGGIDVTPAKDGPPRHVEFALGSDPQKLRDVVVQPGDTVFVRRADTIYVLGAVNRPGGYLMVHGGKLNVLEAVSLAYGTLPAANTKELRILRPDAAGYVDITVPYQQIVRGEQPPLALHPNDILYVPTSGLKTFFLNGSAIISTAASAAIYKF